VFVLSAFAGGILWRQSKVDRATAQVVAPETSEEQRAEALRLFDEAVRARYEGHLQSAIDAAKAARRIDPNFKGPDILLGEIAIEQKHAEAIRQAADHAITRSESKSSAMVLRALEAWMLRGETGSEKAGSTAELFLSEAAEEEPSDSSIRFFLGELSRMRGNGINATEHLLAALYRLVPWVSCDLIRLKWHLAAREADPSQRNRRVELPPLDTRTKRAVATREGPSEPASILNLIELTSALQTKELLKDSSFAHVAAMPELVASVIKAASPLRKPDQLPPK
jgi:hypothetical protein